MIIFQRIYKVLKNNGKFRTIYESIHFDKENKDFLKYREIINKLKI